MMRVLTVLMASLSLLLASCAATGKKAGGSCCDHKTGSGSACCAHDGHKH